MFKIMIQYYSEWGSLKGLYIHYIFVFVEKRLQKWSFKYTKNVSLYLRYVIWEDNPSRIENIKAKARSSLI